MDQNTAVVGPPPSDLNWVEPIRLGGYRLVRKLGKGGAGTVFLAEDPAGERVAVKLLHPGAGSEDQARLLREGRLAARLKHPNVVRVRGAGEHAGRPFLVLDWVEGGSLQDRLQTGPVSSVRAVLIAQRLAFALQHAHERKVLHRDVKPSNVLLDRKGEPLLTDFGLAKDRGSGHGSLMTMEGDVLGTPSFMAPEQALGELDRVGPRTDVYGLGATLYAMLTGLPPFAGQFVRVLAGVVHCPPIAPSKLADVDARLEAIALRCLEKDPEDRYATALDLAQDLSRYGRRRSGGRITRKIAPPRPSSGRNPVQPSVDSNENAPRASSSSGSSSAILSSEPPLWLPAPEGKDGPELSLCDSPDPNARPVTARARRRTLVRRRSPSQRLPQQAPARVVAPLALTLGVLLAVGFGLAGSSSSPAAKATTVQARAARPDSTRQLVSSKIAKTAKAQDEPAATPSEEAAEAPTEQAERLLDPDDAWELEEVRAQSDSEAPPAASETQPAPAVAEVPASDDAEFEPPPVVATRTRRPAGLTVLRVGTLTGQGLDLSEGAVIPQAATLHAGTRPAEIESEGAVHVTLAPRARFSTRRADDGRRVFHLERGSLFARTDGKYPYAIHTPDGLLTPIGTEFLVSISSSSGKTRCATFDGEVQVSDPSPESSGLELRVRSGFEVQVARGRVSRLPGPIEHGARAVRWLPKRLRPKQPTLPTLLHTVTFDDGGPESFEGSVMPVGAFRSRACLRALKDKNSAITGWAGKNLFPLRSNVWVEAMCKVSRRTKVTFKVHGKKKSVKLQVKDVQPDRWVPLVVSLKAFRSSSGSKSVADLEGACRRLEIKAGCSDDALPVELLIDNVRVFALD